MKTIPEKMAMRPSTHRQPSVIPRKPPTMGPITGPMKGATEKMLIARPRSLAENKSATTPPAFVSGEDPKAPPKNRRMRRVQTFFDPAAPALKTVKARKVPKKTTWRPYSSLKGAHSSGPRAKPNTKRDTPSVTISCDAPNSFRICWIPFQR